MGSRLMALVFIAPLFFYLLAAISHGVARVLGGKGTGFGARLALFWALAVHDTRDAAAGVGGRVHRGWARGRPWWGFWSLRPFFIFGSTC
jgi:hypothetical protein